MKTMPEFWLLVAALEALAPCTIWPKGWSDVALIERKADERVYLARGWLLLCSICLFGQPDVNIL